MQYLHKPVMQLCELLIYKLLIYTGAMRHVWHQTRTVEQQSGRGRQRASVDYIRTYRGRKERYFHAVSVCVAVGFICQQISTVYVDIFSVEFPSFEKKFKVNLRAR